MNYPTASILSFGALAYLMATLLASFIARVGFPLPPAGSRLGCIDGLRGYLALSVLIHHFVIWMQITRLGGEWASPSVNFFEQLGAAGVALFFMTTGFVFYPRVRAGFSACSWPAVYIARIFRIVPLIITSTIIVIYIIYIRTGNSPEGNFPLDFLQWITAWNEPPLLGYENSFEINAGVLWSLWYEWLFYFLILPACALAMDLMRHKIPSWVLPVTIFVTATILRVLHVPSMFLSYLPLFAVGMIAFECKDRAYISDKLIGPFASLAAIIALLSGMIIRPQPYTIALPLFGFFFVCIACGNSMWGVLRTKGALVLGECSYGIYLLHGIVLSVLFVDASIASGYFETKWLPALLPLSAVGVALITPITYLLVERPAIRAGRHLAKYWAGRRIRLNASETQIAP